MNHRYSLGCSQIIIRHGLLKLSFSRGQPLLRTFCIVFSFLACCCTKKNEMCSEFYELRRKSVRI